MKMVTLLTIYYCLTTLLAWQIGHPAGVLARVFFFGLRWLECFECAVAASPLLTLYG